TDAWAQPGQTATFSVVAQAFGALSPLSYQWLRNQDPIPNATNATYTTGPLTLSNKFDTFTCLLNAEPFSVQTQPPAFLTVIDNSTPYAQSVRADNPLLYYRMEETGSSRAYDSSGHGFHGDYSQNVLHQAGTLPGLGSSASFQGADFIAVPDLNT